MSQILTAKFVTSSQVASTNYNLTNPHFYEHLSNEITDEIEVFEFPQKKLKNDEFFGSLTVSPAHAVELELILRVNKFTFVDFISSELRK